MKWPTPINPAEITGKQTLTGDKPITKLSRAVKDLQDLAVVGATVTINGKDMPCRVADNKLVVDGNINVSATAAQETDAEEPSGKLKCITGLTVSIATSGTTLTLTISPTGKELDLSTMTIADAAYDPIEVSVDGVEC